MKRWGGEIEPLGLLLNATNNNITRIESRWNIDIIPKTQLGVHKSLRLNKDGWKIIRSYAKSTPKSTWLVQNRPNKSKSYSASSNRKPKLSAVLVQ